jgi:hypothetical protein
VGVNCQGGQAVAIALWETEADMRRNEPAAGAARLRWRAAAGRSAAARRRRAPPHRRRGRASPRCGRAAARCRGRRRTPPRAHTPSRARPRRAGRPSTAADVRTGARARRRISPRRPSKPSSRNVSAAFGPARLAPTITNMRSLVMVGRSPFNRRAVARALCVGRLGAWAYGWWKTCIRSFARPARPLASRSES